MDQVHIGGLPAVPTGAEVLGARVPGVPPAPGRPAADAGADAAAEAGPGSGGGVRRVLRPDDALGAPGLLVLALAVFGLGYVAVLLAPADTRVAAWWPAAGVAVVALLRAPRDRRLAVAVTVAVASGLANAAAGRAWPGAVGFALSNTAEAVVVALLVLRHGRARLVGLEDVVRLVAATLAGAAVMALGAGLTVHLTEGGDVLAAARTVVASHTAAVLVVAPLALPSVAARLARRRLELVVQVLGLVAVTLATFAPGQRLPVAFLPIPFLVWAALRLGLRVVGAELLLLAVVVTWSSRETGNPLTGQLPEASALRASLVQAYLFVCALVSVPLAVTVGQRRVVLERVLASERLFRQGFSDALLGMLLLRRTPAREGTGAGAAAGGSLDVVELNDVAARLLTCGADDAAADDVAADGAAATGPDGPDDAAAPRRPTLVGTSWTARLDPDHRREVLARAAQLASGELDGWHGEVALRTGAGSRWVEVALSPLDEVAGRGLFVAQMVDVTARREVEERLTAQALRDGLTGLGNRTMLLREVDAAAAALPDDGSGVAVLFCDLDDFKEVNDSGGHSEGDRVLVEVARRLTAVLGPDDVAARLGGDEFVVLRRRAREAGEAQALAAAALEALGEPVVVRGQRVRVGASIGIAWGGPGATADALLRDADAAMYAAKGEGKCRAVLFSDALRERAARALRLEAELHDALARDELEMHMQPVVDLRDGRTVAAEALVRWRHPGRGLLGPAEWLDVAETTGLMPALGTWVLRRSCELAAGWPVGTVPAPAVHVNVSARQLEVPGFVEVVRDVLAETGLEPGRLVLEFTETQLDDVSPELLEDLARLRRAGIGLAADDFGTGYSPLTRVTELPISMIKIDRGFVAAMLDDVRSQAIVTTLVRLSDSLGLDLVAEGVETEEQAQALRMLGCATGQGYLWSRPVPEPEFRASLAGTPR